MAQDDQREAGHKMADICLQFVGKLNHVHAVVKKSLRDCL